MWKSFTSLYFQNDQSHKYFLKYTFDNLAVSYKKILKTAINESKPLKTTRGEVYLQGSIGKEFAISQTRYLFLKKLVLKSYISN